MQDRIDKQTAMIIWRRDYKPDVLEQFPNDKPALRLSWSYFTDDLCKSGNITLRQYETWTYPPECK